MNLDRTRRRSVGFLERDGEEWACYLVTFSSDDHRWRGYFSFRPPDAEEEDEEIRTADIFLEASEAEIDHKARGLGRPLLSGLLASALHSRERDEDGAPPRLRRWFRTILSENSRELTGEWEEVEEEEKLPDLHSLYSSYRLDQVAHFIALIRPEHFQEAVDRILDGRSMDFAGKDRLQFAMMVVAYIEEHLPLPPYEAWVEDYLAHPEEYRLYAHTLHRAGRLP